jgi:thioredoxin reductase (NADPH)
VAFDFLLAFLTSDFGILNYSMYDLIIVGAGIAGWSAALFAARRGLRVLVVGKDVGGQANYTDTIENYPGVVQTGGFELVSTVRSQAENFGATFLEAEVSNIKPAADSSFVITAYGKQYKSQTLILSYGKTPQDLAVTGENEFKGKGVSYCATCDAPLYKGKDVAVVGVGDLAADAALLCSKFARKVYVLTKRTSLRHNPPYIKFCLKKPMWSSCHLSRSWKLRGIAKFGGCNF